MRTLMGIIEVKSISQMVLSHHYSSYDLGIALLRELGDQDVIIIMTTIGTALMRGDISIVNLHYL